MSITIGHDHGGGKAGNVIVMRPTVITYASDYDTLSDATIDDTWGEEGFAHWEIVFADRRRYEAGHITRDPCAGWSDAADTSQFVSWYRERTAECPIDYPPARICTRALRRAYLEYCCMYRLRPRTARAVQVDLVSAGVRKTRNEAAPKGRARATTYRITPYECRAA